MLRQQLEKQKIILHRKEYHKEDIAQKCRKVLALKYWSGLNKPQPIIKENISREISPASSKAFIRDLYANALTVLVNNEDIIPVKKLETVRIATVAY